MSDGNKEDGERIAALEVRLEFLEKQIVDMNKKVTEMYETLIKAKGLKVVLVGTGLFIGFLFKYFLVHIQAFFQR